MIDAKIHTSIITQITVKIFFILTPLFYILIILHFKENVNSFSKNFLWYFMEKRPGKLVKYGNYGVNKRAAINAAHGLFFRCQKFLPVVYYSFIFFCMEF